MGPDQAEGSPPGVQPDLGSTSLEMQQTPDLKVAMNEAMQKLQSRNSEFGGKLLTRIGSGETRALLLETPTREQISQLDGSSKDVKQYLLATDDGFKVLQADVVPIRNPMEGTSPDQQIDDRLEKSLLHELKKEGSGGYDSTRKALKFMHNGREVSIDSQGFRLPGESSPWADKFRLQDVSSPDTVTNIIKVNLEKIKNEQEEANRKQLEEEERARPSIQAAQKLDELLS